MNIVPRSHSVIAQAPPRTRTQRDAIFAPEAPGEARGDRRINGEVEREQDDGDPAEPGRHRRLEGEGGRDPVEADDELAEAERPAGAAGPATRLLRAADEFAQHREGDRQQRPQRRRLEGEGRSGAGKEGVKDASIMRSDG